MKTAKRANEALWTQCKAQALQKMGKFSARAMQYAVQLYKKSGGTYIGPKGHDNALRVWTKEEWGYVGAAKQSRYLPKAVRDALKPGEKAATSKAKNLGTKRGEQWVPQPATIRRKTSRLRKAIDANIITS